MSKASTDLPSHFVDNIPAVLAVPVNTETSTSARIKMPLKVSACLSLFSFHDFFQLPPGTPLPDGENGGERAAWMFETPKRPSKKGFF